MGGLAPFRWALLAAAALGLLTLGVPWLNDDYMHLLILEAAAGTRAPPDPVFAPTYDALGVLNLYEFLGRAVPVQDSVRNGGLPWYTLPELRISFWRPLASLLAQGEHMLSGGRAWVAHLHSGLWFVALVVLVCGLYARLIPAAAPLAALVFALDEVHTLPVLWAANRNALVAAVFGVGALGLHLRAREQGDRRAAVGAWLCLVGALGAGEAGLGAFAYLAAYEGFGRSDPWSRRMKALAPALGLGLLWAALYKAQGFGSSGSTLYVDPVGEPWAWLGQAPEKSARLAGALLTGWSADLGLFAPALRGAQAVVGGLAVLGAAALGRVLWPELRPEERRALRWLGPGALGATVPVLSTFALDRLLLWASLAAAVAVAAGLEAAGRRGWRALRGGLRLVHLGLPVLGWVGMCGMLTFAGHRQERLARELLEEGRWAGRTVILLGASDMGLAVYLPMMAEQLRLPTPDVFVQGVPAPVDATLTRTSADTLEIRLHEPGFYAGFVPRLVGRAGVSRLEGHTATAGGLEVQVLDTGPLGPTRWRYRAPGGLEAVGLWRWTGAAVEAVPLPAVGEALALPWVPGPMGL